MSDRDRAADAEGEHRRALRRLEDAVAQQRRVRDEHQMAKDTPDEITAVSSLEIADDQVAARERWLKSVDDHAY